MPGPAGSPTQAPAGEDLGALEAQASQVQQELGSGGIGGLVPTPAPPSGAPTGAAALGNVPDTAAKPDLAAFLHPAHLEQQSPPAQPPLALGLMVAAKMPALDAATKVAVAQSSADASDVVTNAHAVAAYGGAAAAAKTLSEFPAAEQREIFGGADPEAQAKLIAAGYVQPREQSGGPGVFGDILHGIGTAAHYAALPAAEAGKGVEFVGSEIEKGATAAGHAIARHVPVVGGALAAAVDAPIGAVGNLVHGVGSDVAALGQSPAAPFASIGKQIGGGLHELSVPYAQVTHGFRAWDYLMREGDPGVDQGGFFGTPAPSKGLLGFDTQLFKYVMTPSRWAQAWQETENGQTTYDPQVTRALQRQLGTGAYAFLQNVADQVQGGLLGRVSGTSIQDAAAAVIAKLPAAAQATAQAFAQTQTFRDGLTQLQNSRSSLGNSLVGERMLNDHPLLANALSGTFNALAGWYGDPVVLGAKATQAAKLARFALDANDVQTLFRTDRQVARAMADVAETMNRENGAVRLMERWPQLRPMVDDLQALKNGHDGHLEAADVARFFSAEQGKVAMLSGRAGLYFQGHTLAPHLSIIGDAMKSGRVALSHSIDWANDEMPVITRKILGLPADSDVAERVVNRPALYRRLTTTPLKRMINFVPRTGVVAYNDPESVETIRRYTRAFLPYQRADELTQGWAAAVGNEAQRRRLLTGIAGELFHATGAAESIPGRDYMKLYQASLDDEARGSRFMATAGADTLPTDGTSERHAAGVGEADMSKTWAIPDYRELRRFVKLSSVMGELRSPIVDRADAFLSRFWRLPILMRFGFAMRAGGEELANAVARMGTLPLRSRLAASALKSGALSPWHPLERLLGGAAERVVESAELRRLTAEGLDEPVRAWWSHQPFRDIADVMTDHWPAPVKTAIHSVDDLIATAVGFPTRIVRAAGKPLAGQELMDAWRELAEHRTLDGPFADLVSSMHANAAGYADDVTTRTTWLRRGLGTAPVELRPGKGWAMIGPDADRRLFDDALALRLSRMHDDRVLRPALDALVDGEKRGARNIAALQRSAVLRALRSPELRDVVNEAERSKVLRDGRVVGIDATLDDALKDWSDVATQAVNELVRREDGRLIRLGDKTLAEHVLERRVGPDLVGKIERSELPRGVVGREVIPYAPNAWDKILAGGMRELVGRPMDWLSRQPIFGANYTLARREVEKVIGKKLGEVDSEEARELIHDISVERATRETIPYIHDIRSRTMFETSVRQLAPFLFAQRQFWTRWAKIMVYSPDAIRHAQILMNGLRVSGFLKKDPSSGQDYFVYPGSGAAINLWSRALAFMHIGSYVPVPSSFTGEVRYLAPGLSGTVPSFSPFLTVPLDLLMTKAPYLSPEIASLGVSTNPAAELSPSIVTRLVQAIYEGHGGTGEVGTSMMQAASYLEAAGLGLGGNGKPDESLTDHEVNVYTSRLQSWATHVMVLRAILGFFVPATPTLNTDKLGLSSEYQRLLKQLGYNEGLAAFVKQFPDGVPYTIGQTTTKSGTALPDTNAGLKYLNDHLAFLSKYPTAAPWLIPQNLGKGSFSDQAYQEQLLAGLRQQRTLPQWFDELLYARDATLYFDAQTTYDKAASDQSIGYSQFEAIQAAYVKWKNNFLSTHPQLAEQIKVGAAATRRRTVMAEMNQALADPSLPASSTTRAIAGLMAGYDTYERDVEAYSAGTTIVAADKSQLRNLTQTFLTWGDRYVAEHPQALPLWAGVISYQVTW